MSAHIEMNRTRVLYEEGPHKLVLPVEWSGMPKTADHPADVEIDARNMQSWTEPAGEPIDAATRERILDELAANYSQGPFADIVGKGRVLLRGVSKYRFYLHVYPKPSLYTEPRRWVEIPMVKTDPKARPQLVLDASNVHRWTSPDEALSPAKLDEILALAVKANPQIGVKR